MHAEESEGVIIRTPRCKTLIDKKNMLDGICISEGWLGIFRTRSKGFVSFHIRVSLPKFSHDMSCGGGGRAGGCPGAGN
jgi:hypothetical protein